MEQTFVDTFLIQHGKLFPPDRIKTVREMLLISEDDKIPLLSAMQFKDPATLTLVSVFLGALGIDRFMVDDVGMGILKLMTCGGCYVLLVYDWFVIAKRAKEKNFALLASVL